MISYGVTGFYPALENNKEQLKQQIEEYMVFERIEGC